MYRIADGDTGPVEPNPYSYTGAGTHIDSTAAAWDGKLYFGTHSGNVCCIDTDAFTSGDWVTNLGAAPVWSSPLVSVPTGTLFAATESGALVRA